MMNKSKFVHSLFCILLSYNSKTKTNPQSRNETNQKYSFRYFSQRKEEKGKTNKIVGEINSNRIIIFILIEIHMRKTFSKSTFKGQKQFYISKKVNTMHIVRQSLAQMIIRKTTF